MKKYTSNELIETLSGDDRDRKFEILEELLNDKPKDVFINWLSINKDKFGIVDDFKDTNKYIFPIQEHTDNIVTLYPDELRIGKFTGELRYADNIFTKNLGDSYSNTYMGGELFHIIGAICEMAACKYINKRPDYEFKNNFACRGKDKGDVKYNGYNIDWKSCKTRNLYIKKRKLKNNIDYFGGVKMLGDVNDLSKPMKVKIMGLIKKEDVSKLGKSNGDSYVVNEDNLCINTLKFKGK